MVAVPSFMSANAKRGLKLLEYAGDGLQPKTVREARAMASGDVTAEKVRRIAAWFARHIVDLDSPKADDYLQGRSERPTPGQVAWLLWGGDLGSAQRLRGQRWAERKRDQLIGDGELSKEVGSEISAAVRDGLKRKVKDHNEKVNNAKGKQVTLSMLEQVFIRGVGAYHSNPSSVRPTVTGPEQWAYARVNGFLSAVRTGRYKSGKFDTDLLPEGHPLKSNNENKTASVSATVTSMTYMIQSPNESQTMAAEEEPVLAIDLTSALQELMANVLVYYASAHRAHWNVMGPDFREYHDLFADIYSDAYESIDPLAENIRKIKGVPLNLTEMVAAASFADDSQTSVARELAGDLLKKNLMLISMLKLVFEVADNYEEQGIANFIAERIDSHMKFDWQLTASLSE